MKTKNIKLLFGTHKLVIEAYYNSYFEEIQNQYDKMGDSSIKMDFSLYPYRIIELYYSKEGDIVIFHFPSEIMERSLKLNTSRQQRKQIIYSNSKLDYDVEKNTLSDLNIDDVNKVLELFRHFTVLAPKWISMSVVKGPDVTKTINNVYSLENAKKNAKKDFFKYVLIPNRLQISSLEQDAIRDSNNLIIFLEEKINEFEGVLKNLQVSEPLLQSFLTLNSLFVSQTHRKFFSKSDQTKIQLGNEFIPDFLTIDNNNTVTLIEIESSNKEIYGKKGALTSKFYQAVGQLKEWRNWLANPINRTAYLQKLNLIGSKYSFKYRLIIGRDSMLTTDQQNYLSTYDPEIEIITYDSIINEMRSLIENIKNK